MTDPSSASEGAAPGHPIVQITASFRPLLPGGGQDEAAATLLGACAPGGTPEEGRCLLDALNAEDASTVYGFTVGDNLAVVYALRKVSMAMEVVFVAVTPSHRGQGLGRAALADAPRRAGARPLVAETDEAGLGFFKACGFKLVGRRKDPNGATRYRLGWHAPNLRTPTLQSGATAPRSAPSSG